MTDNDAYAAKIAGKIRDDNVAAREYVAAIYKIADERGNAALECVAEKRDDPHFQPEFSAHIHRARIPAADFCNILMLETRNQLGEIEAADEITDHSHQYELIPAL